jgi:hypothetical protein
VAAVAVHRVAVPAAEAAAARFWTRSISSHGPDPIQRGSGRFLFRSGWIFLEVVIIYLADTGC